MLYRETVHCLKNLERVLSDLEVHKDQIQYNETHRLTVQSDTNRQLMCLKTADIKHED